MPEINEKANVTRTVLDVRDLTVTYDTENGPLDTVRRASKIAAGDLTASWANRARVRPPWPGP